MSPEATREALRTVFEELVPDRLEAKAVDIRCAVDDLMRLGLQPRLPEHTKEARLRSHRPATRKTSEAEFERYARIAEEFAAAAEGFHQPAVIALANGGGTLWRYEGEMLRDRAARVRAMKALIPDITSPPHPGRPRDGLARAVAGLVVTHFEWVTGANADLPGEAAGLEGCTRQVFEIFEIKASAKAAVRAALETRVERAKKPSPKNMS